MIAAWMAYCLGITTLLAAGAFALDRALRLGRRPTRWVWAGALAASVALPLAARLRPEAFSPVIVPTLAPPRADVATISPALPASAPAPVVSPRPFSLSDLDRPLLWLWGGLSVTICAILAVAAWRLARLRRQWLPASLEGRTVLVSDDVGPAVANFWSHDLVFPLWTLGLDDRQRRLMLAHEEEHVRARDPWLLATAGLILVAVPWNLAAWWLLRRLRLAVEMDCDARVLRRGQDVASYGALLLAVGGRASRRLIGAAALGEPVSFLEHRIRSMTAAMPRAYARQAIGLVAVAGAALMLACEAPRPEEPPLSSAVAAQASPDARFTTGVVEEQPEMLTGPQPAFPQLLRLAGIGGRVTAQAVIDTSGRIESNSIKILSSPNPGFNPAVIDALRHSTFRPARLHGHAVRVRIQIPYDFNASPSIAATVRQQMLGFLRPEIRTGLQAYYPTLIGQSSGPALDIWLGHDARGRVIRAARTRNSERAVDGDQIRRALPEFRPGHDAWEVVDRTALRGIVRDNVRVIWVYID